MMTVSRPLFSILLPTFNRLDLLKQAVYTVLNQDFDDWELVISDNFSTENVAAYVQSLRDPRIHYQRTTSFVSVTENWNLAIDRAQGRYILMLGDDDGLIKGSLSHLSKIIAEHDNPDLIYCDVVQFAYPNVFPFEKASFVQRANSHFFNGLKTEPFYIEQKEALEYVSESLEFRIPFQYNMQHFVISRSTYELLKRSGPFFDSPYPDYFAANALFALVGRILAVPEPLVYVGISPKSFGFYFLNSLESDGNKVLNNELQGELKAALERVSLPGLKMNTSWLAAMYLVKKRLNLQLPLKVWRYRLVQFMTSFDRNDQETIRAQLKRARISERIFAWLLRRVKSWSERNLSVEQKPQFWGPIFDWWTPYYPANLQRRYTEWPDLVSAFDGLESDHPIFTRELSEVRPVPSGSSVVAHSLRMARSNFYNSLIRSMAIENEFDVMSPRDWEAGNSLVVRVRKFGLRRRPVTIHVLKSESEQSICSFRMIKERGSILVGRPDSTLPPGSYIVQGRNRRGGVIFQMGFHQL
jgi:glycosyltransferase involved in cell wall biosynthesis